MVPQTHLAAFKRRDTFDVTGGRSKQRLLFLNTTKIFAVYRDIKRKPHAAVVLRQTDHSVFCLHCSESHRGVAAETVQNFFPHHPSNEFRINFDIIAIKGYPGRYILNEFYLGWTPVNYGRACRRIGTRCSDQNHHYAEKLLHIQHSFTDRVVFRGGHLTEDPLKKSGFSVAILYLAEKPCRLVAPFVAILGQVFYPLLYGFKFFG